MTKNHVKFNYVTPPENVGQVIFRFLSTLIVRSLSKTAITPNQVTIARSFVVVISLYGFSLGDPVSLLWAVALFYTFEVLDHVDGDLARFTGKLSSIGPLLEQFVDTWSSRPSNVFGFCIALGMYNNTHEFIGFVLFGVTALGRILWLEYRDYFGWERGASNEPKEYQSVFKTASIKISIKNLFEVLYVWNNTFLLIAALIYMPMMAWVGWDALEIAFVIVAILNNIPWIFIVIRGFREAVD